VIGLDSVWLSISNDKNDALAFSFYRLQVDRVPELVHSGGAVLVGR